jgi:hypothetical protein
MRGAGDTPVAMLRSRGALTLSLLVIAASATSASCKKKAGAVPGDAGASAGDASASPEAGPLNATAATYTNETSEPAPSAPVPHSTAPATSIPMAPREPPATPFTGNYRCFKGMRLEQAGTIVTSTMHTNATTDTVVACTVAGDVCTGTVREIQTTRGKSPKVTHVKPVTLRRSANGDVTYNVGATDAKPGASDRDHTFCPRR